jgi:catechol 2,3-dioxygenase-like lactoylglutathione lyase family enzyme
MTAINGVDHVVIAVRDLDEAAARWQRLGFTLSPRGVHSAHMGTANHTMMLRGNDYFEIIAVIAPTERNAARRALLAQREGLGDIALASPSAAAARDAWRAAGLPGSDLIAFQRPVDRPGGVVVQAKFEVTDLGDHPVPGAHPFVCGQLTRDAVWLPELLDHPNGAQAILEVSFVAPDPAACAAAWAQVTGGSRDGDTVLVGRHRLTMLTPAAATARFGTLPNDIGSGPAALAISYQVSDLARTAGTLTTNGLPYRSDANRILVDAAEANGVMVEFRL